MQITCPPSQETGGSIYAATLILVLDSCLGPMIDVTTEHCGDIYHDMLLMSQFITKLSLTKTRTISRTCVHVLQCEDTFHFTGQGSQHEPACPVLSAVPIWTKVRLTPLNKNQVERAMITIPHSSTGPRRFLNQFSQRDLIKDARRLACYMGGIFSQTSTPYV